MSTPTIDFCSVSKLPSGVYELKWKVARGDSGYWDEHSKFYTKAQLIKLANGNKTYGAIKSYLQSAIRSGEVIK